MKKYKLLGVTLLSIFVGIFSVKALSEEDYNRLRIVYSDAYISTMTEEEINKALAMDLENTQTVKTYYKGTSNNSNGSYTWKEVTEAIYNSADVMPISDDFYSENYKEIGISVTKIDDDTYQFYTLARWKYMPTVRSFDVIGFRFHNIAIMTNSQSGRQVFSEVNNSSTDFVGYSPNGTNIKKSGNDFGISMNLVNNDIDMLELCLTAYGMVSASNPQVWASYQHAAKDVTLAQSQNYTISSAGMGSVINFDPKVEIYYDNMPGVTYKIS